MILSVRNSFAHFFHELGSVYLFSTRVFRVFFQTQGNFKPIMAQVASVSIRSLSTVAFAGIFVGAILVLQMDLILSKYDAQSLLGGLNTSTVVREVGPLIISFLLAGKIGAFTAAELGTMRVTEQIDAIECLGNNPIQYLIVPRLLGIMISSLILLAIGLLISVAGAMVVASVHCGINFLEFASSIPKFTNAWTVIGAVIKSLVYGSIVAAVSCHRGFTASGGARGVGRAVTLAALYTNFYILIANFLVSNILEFMWEISQAIQGNLS
jgi:phospholipid/cholesterol/gamma-HCH transport system permease protein